MKNDTAMNETPEKKKSTRILALAGVVLLVALYGSTLVFALMNSPHAINLLMASVCCTILIPVLLYVYQMIFRLSGRKKEQIRSINNADKKNEDKSGKKL